MFQDYSAFSQPVVRLIHLWNLSTVWHSQLVHKQQLMLPNPNYCTETKTCSQKTHISLHNICLVYFLKNQIFCKNIKHKYRFTSCLAILFEHPFDYIFFTSVLNGASVMILRVRLPPFDMSLSGSGFPTAQTNGNNKGGRHERSLWKYYNNSKSNIVMLPAPLHLLSEEKSTFSMKH